VINYNSINWYHFDHKIYLSYLILHHNFTILNITPILNHSMSLETYNTTNIEDLKILKSFNYGFSFLNRYFYNNNVEFLKNEGTFILFHVDR
jgi:hypothetical protein